jgi:Icc-related predicted phosphoesterase
MKILTYSDMHLEFGVGFSIPPDTEADILVLSGDILTFKDLAPLTSLLDGWNKPVIFVSGNHEYYSAPPIAEVEQTFREWLKEHHPNVGFLQNESVSLDGIHFFGGTMWTDFNGANPLAMQTAKQQMNDFRLIRTAPGKLLTPEDTVSMHEAFVAALIQWFETPLDGQRVVITHHAPVRNPQTQYGNSPLQPAFNSLDMVAIIEKFQPALWIYGHTHECDRHTIGETLIISNQRGYPRGSRGFECHVFDMNGALVEL